MLLLTIVYYGAALFGLQYASIGKSVSLVWPPSGIAFAALTLLGYRYWPGVALGAFLANAATDVPLLASAGIALGNTLEALVAALLLRHTAGSRLQLGAARLRLASSRAAERAEADRKYLQRSPGGAFLRSDPPS